MKGQLDVHRSLQKSISTLVNINIINEQYMF